MSKRLQHVWKERVMNIYSNELHIESCSDGYPTALDIIQGLIHFNRLVRWAQIILVLRVY